MSGRPEWIVGLLDLLELPQPQSFCPRTVPLHLQSKKDQRKHQVFQPGCRCWTCVPCAARLRRDHGVHFGGRLLDCPSPLFASTTTNWPTDQRTLRRAKASWVRVGTTVIGTAPLKGGSEVEPNEAVRLLGAAIRGLARPDDTQRFQPIACSADWKAPRRDGPAWTLLGSTAEPDVVASILTDHGVRPKRGGDAVYWNTPQGWGPDEEEQTNKAIAKRRRSGAS